MRLVFWFEVPAVIKLLLSSSIVRLILVFMHMLFSPPWRLFVCSLSELILCFILWNGSSLVTSNSFYTFPLTRQAFVYCLLLTSCSFIISSLSLFSASLLFVSARAFLHFLLLGPSWFLVLGTKRAERLKFYRQISCVM